MSRVRGFRANSSTKSHAELDESTGLDDGDQILVGQPSVAILRRFPNINVVGGCRGTDTRHVKAIAEQLATENTKR